MSPAFLAAVAAVPNTTAWLSLASATSFCASAKALAAVSANDSVVAPLTRTCAAAKALFAVAKEADADAFSVAVDATDAVVAAVAVSTPVVAATA